MKEDLTIRICGEAGQGTQTLGIALCKLFKRNGLHLFAHQDVMSRIRGGNNFTQVRISSKSLYTLRQKADIIVALDKASVALHKPSLASGGAFVLDKNKFKINSGEKYLFDVPLFDLAQKTGGSDILINSVAFGLLAGMTGADLCDAQEILKDLFSDKSEEIIKKNKEAAQAGFDFCKSHFMSGRFLLKKGPVQQGLLMNGNEALAMAAVRAGCKFYSAYPMSPSTSIMNMVAHYAKKFNIVVEQAEDEIAAINMALGASFAGVRAMCATSGGGFALMVEGLSLAGMTETPIVIVDAQRPAPATGFPTRTEQADLDFLIHAGHGEFAKVVYAPGTAEQAFVLTVKAFNIAEKYQVPVMIMTDQHLAESSRDIPMFDLDKAKVKRYIISKKDSEKVRDYKRYKLTPSGISPLAVPSWIQEVIYVDSDEHTEEGHITEDAAIRTQMVKKRFHKKMAGLSREVEKPFTYNLKGAKTILIGFGSTYGVMQEASEALKQEKIGLIHLSQVWPFPAKALLSLLKNAKNVLTVENNAAGQLSRLIRRETGIKVPNSILKFDGRPFDLDFLIARLKKGS
jgi:2-oxoglutarate/2-oxoacid ferredoxin oxidoreductase subunit alpha